MDVIADGTSLHHLYYLLEFLAAWEKRPGFLTAMAYKWCSAISEAAGRLGEGGVPIIQPRDKIQPQLRRRFQRILQPRSLRPGLKLRLRLRQQDPALGEGHGYLSPIIEGEFSQVGPGCDTVRSGRIPNRAQRSPLVALTPLHYIHLLSMTLEIGFRLAAPSRDQLALHLNHTPYHDWVFEIAFSSEDDEVIADAMCAWIADRDHMPPGSFVRYFAERVERVSQKKWRDFNGI